MKLQNNSEVFYDSNTKWIPKGTVMHGSNILPQIINWKKKEI